MSKKTIICNSYTMDCPSVHGDNPRALANELSCVQVDNRGITILNVSKNAPFTAQPYSRFNAILSF